MTIDQAVKRAAEQAAQFGYSFTQFKAFEQDLREMLYNLEECDEASVDKLVEELF